MLILNIQNIGGSDSASMYRVTVHVNTREIWLGIVGPHNRGAGWEALVKNIAEVALLGEGTCTNDVRRECPTCKTTQVIKA